MRLAWNWPGIGKKSRSPRARRADQREAFYRREIALRVIAACALRDCCAVACARSLARVLVPREVITRDRLEKLRHRVRNRLGLVLGCG
jgi:hypothetical protein